MDDFDSVVDFDDPIENFEPIPLYDLSADAWSARNVRCLRVPADELNRRIDRREDVGRAFRTAFG